MLQTLKSAAGAALIAVLCVLLYWPRPHRAPAPATPAAPYCLDVQHTALATEATTKTCSPACKAPQVCVDGTCCLPAVSHSPGSSAAFAWVADSLR